MSDLNISEKLIRGYEVRECLGMGGFGAVYRAYQPVVGREVAVKVILPQYANQPDFIRRFETEAQLVARLEHPHIVPLFDYWREPGSAYLVMRCLHGGSLRNSLDKYGSWSPEDVSTLLDQLSGALMTAHRNNVIHRDLKPDNILLDEDQNAYLVDFGIAEDLTSTVTTTKDSAVVGTPAYLSPEQAKSMPPTPQTDLYSLGIILYELLTGKQPFQADTYVAMIMKHLQESLPPLNLPDSQLSLSLDAVLQRATAKDAVDRYSSALSLAAAFRKALNLSSKKAPTDDDNLLIMLDPSADNGLDTPYAGLTPTGLVLPEPENPYKGLRAFQEADAVDFFGRQSLIDRLLARLQDSEPYARFLAVVGPSGSGKSSVVKAGLFPALRRDAVYGCSKWFMVEMVPGAQPLEDLEIALLRIAVNPPTDLLNQLRADEGGLLKAVQRILPSPESQLLLVIDQFEELFTRVEDETVRRHFLDNLITAVSDPNSQLRVIITLRADFYDRPLLYPGFCDLIQQRTEIVLPLSPDELEQAVAGPARRVGMDLEPALIAAIIGDVGQQPGALPLLQYTLTELYERREGRLLTLNGYRACGGVLGALARRADELYLQLDPSRQPAVRQLFLRLVTLGEGTEDTRRRIRQSEFGTVAAENTDNPVNDVITLYGKYRLLTFDRDPVTRGPTIEVAHEALIRKWERLRDWLNKSREAVRLQQRIAGAAVEWENARRDPSFLASGSRLAQFEALSTEAGANADIVLNQQERAYLEASIAYRNQQEIAERERQTQELMLARKAARAQRIAAIRLRVVVVMLALLLVGAVAFSILTVKNLRHADSLRLSAEAITLMQTGGGPELAALLSIRAIQLDRTEQASKALVSAGYSNFAIFTYQQKTSVTGVAYSPDGKYIASGSGNPFELLAGTVSPIENIAELWDTQTGEHVRTFSGHSAQVWSVKFSADSQSLLTSSSDGTARLWNVQTGQEIRQFRGHSSAVTSAVFSPDEKTIVTSSFDKTVRLWNTQTGETLRTLTTRDQVWDTVFSPDGAYIAATDGNLIQLWDAQTGQLAHTFQGHTDTVIRLAFSPDSSRLLSSSRDNTLRLWDVKTGVDVFRFGSNHDFVTALAFAPDGQHILTGGFGHHVLIWHAFDAQGWAVEHDYNAQSDSIFGVAYSPNGKFIVSASADQTVRLANANADAQRDRLAAHTGPVTSVAYSPDGRYILTGSLDTTVHIWNSDTDTVRQTLSGHTTLVSAVAFSPDSQRIVTASWDGTARVWDFETAKTLLVFKGHTNQVNGAAFSPDGKYVLTGSSDGTAQLWDSQTGQVIQTFGDHSTAVLRVAFAPGGKSVLTANGATAKLWDVQTGQLLQTFSGHTKNVLDIAFSPDGKQIATASIDTTAKLWDAQTGALIRTFDKVHTSQVWAVRFSPDGKTIATAGFDSIIQLWDVQTGNKLQTFQSDGAIYSLAFSPDGSQIVSGNSSSDARLWYLDSNALVRVLCRRLKRDLTDQERLQYDLDNRPTCASQQ